MNKRIALTYLSPILFASLIGCQQSGTSADRDATSPLAPSLEAAAKDDNAKPIRILSGQLIYDRATGAFPIELKGTQGLRLEVVVRDHLAFFVPRLDCEPCAPGSRVRLDGMFIDTSLTGSVRLHGKTYQLGQGLSDARLAIEFTGDGVVTPTATEGQTVELTAPFEVTGIVFIPVGAGSPAEHPFAGEGVATLSFAATVLAPGQVWWVSTRAVYDFH